MGKGLQASAAQLRRLRELRRERAKLRAAFGLEHQGIFRDLVDLIQRSLRRKPYGEQSDL